MSWVRCASGNVSLNIWVVYDPEFDISVSRLPGLETFAIFLVVSVSVSENLVSEKKSRSRYRKIWSRKKSLGIGIGKFGLVKKVSVLVSENLVSEKKVSVSVSENLDSDKNLQRKIDKSSKKLPVDAPKNYQSHSKVSVSVSVSRPTTFF